VFSVRLRGACTLFEQASFSDPFVGPQVQKMTTALSSLTFFAHHQWRFDTSNAEHIANALSPDHFPTFAFDFECAPPALKSSPQTLGYALDNKPHARHNKGASLFLYSRGEGRMLESGLKQAQESRRSEESEGW
jgi:hypothetical protein